MRCSLFFVNKSTPSRSAQVFYLQGAGTDSLRGSGEPVQEFRVALISAR